MDPRAHRKTSFIRLLLPMMCMIICMIGSLHACSAPKVTFPTEDEIRAIVLSHLRENGFENATRFAVFVVSDRESNAKTKDDSMKIEIAFVADDIYYTIWFFTTKEPGRSFPSIRLISITGPTIPWPVFRGSVSFRI